MSVTSDSSSPYTGVSRSKKPIRQVSSSLGSCGWLTHSLAPQGAARRGSAMDRADTRPRTRGGWGINFVVVSNFNHPVVVTDHPVPTRISDRFRREVLDIHHPRFGGQGWIDPSNDFDLIGNTRVYLPPRAASILARKTRVPESISIDCPLGVREIVIDHPKIPIYRNE